MLRDMIENGVSVVRTEGVDHGFPRPWSPEYDLSHHARISSLLP